MIHRLTLFAVIATLILTLAACGGNETQPAEAPPLEPAVEEAAAEPLPTATLVPEPEPLTDAPDSAEAGTDVAESTFESPVSPVAMPQEEPPAEPVLRTFSIVPDQSEASYAVEEEFFNRPIDFFTAVGVTNDIEGQFTLTTEGHDDYALNDSNFVVDLRTLQSDDERRDNRIRQQWLESNTYPLAEFTNVAVENFPETASEGQDVSFQLTGDMTIREVTNPVTFDTTARLEGNQINGAAVTNLLMRDFGFEPPNILNVLKVTDGVTVTVNFVATESGN